ncbi:Type I Polyketide synthases (Type I PKS) [Penicillium cataractarum]|uniref:Type I Polyketide synthases (Type I PKS) n=1 Tax=Penicillium cataractarum TaxID=2100454 RepID=A0A9W9SLN6_9EURO|nr:Type I Polyketide synthases (Type I PKS) [Penicillium cataractarum]KAJ5379964.1 Type I Polyketide synthases (Type I PKS) [Penicillium cataractarum]
MSLLLPSAIVCGPQTNLPSKRNLDRLRNYLTQRSDVEHLLQAVTELPDLLSALQEHDPDLRLIPVSSLNHLREWCLDHSIVLQIPETLPNVLLAPLTVLIHIIQYLEYCDHLSSEDAHARLRQSIRNGGFQGLCTGSLSAAALACSTTRAEIDQNAAVALNLAMCIGAYVDLGLALEPDSPMTCFIARWRHGSQREDVDQILNNYPQVRLKSDLSGHEPVTHFFVPKAYVSVNMDECSATITALEASIPALRDCLRSKSIQFAKVQVNGRYHTVRNIKSLGNLLEFSQHQSKLRFPQTDYQNIPWRNNTTGKVVERADQLHEICLRSILTEPASWHLTISETVKTIASATPDDCHIQILEVGLISCVPSSLSSLPNVHVSRAAVPGETQNISELRDYNYTEECIAVVGAACKYPGAESLDELWRVISTAQTMNGQAPSQRYDPTDLRQGPSQSMDLSGNFISGVDQFDYSFFGISPREAMYMDPQQRIALQVAYRAVESSGYFGDGSQTTEVGCYLGVGGSDYEHNVNAHTPTAFSFIGTSRAFISGRISHFFRWTGPSMTIDTACSSSAVAIHQACRDILSGDCAMALAGGINVMSNSTTHQNLATANFLNATSTPCRSFDSGGNGYSRGEGCGLVVLKKLTVAVADGDHILGVIPATATNQSDGSSSITVPVSEQQISLYRRALGRAKMIPEDISYVEAHGTGTPRGDPIEWRSIHEVFGRGRESNLNIGSVKGNIGHTEAASGVASVLKVLLMIKYQQLPPQAHFTSLNHDIPSAQQKHLTVNKRSLQWNRRLRAACVNNYGASGNNTVIIVCEPPKAKTTKSLIRDERGNQTGTSHPFLISGHSLGSLKRNIAAISKFVDMCHPTLDDVAFNVARMQNRSLRHRVVFGASSLEELQHRLKDPSHLSLDTHTTEAGPKPVVMVFSGQSGVTVHLHKAVYDASCLVRKHVDQCDAILRSMGLPSMFPAIFSQDPISDIVQLHCAIFTLQYACAAAWLDSGLSVQRVIGHSFGQLTAMCVAGIITLSDGLKLVSGRAKLIESKWGNEKGAMLSIKADRATTVALTQSEAKLGLEIACFNGPTSHVLVGSNAAIETVASTASNSTVRKLNTSHGFHSRYIDSFLDEYLELAQSINYSTPTIPIETCSELSSWESFTPALVVEHSRKPVYFVDAVRRIKESLGSCVWLEAGSGSSGVTLAKSALNGSDSDSFHGLQLGTEDALESLSETTSRLWKDRVSVQFWKYHRGENSSFKPLSLPGYQFDETSHWLPRAERVRNEPLSKRVPPMLSLENFSSPERHLSVFTIDQLSSEIAEILQARKVLDGLLWPLSLYIELVCRAAALLTPALPREFQRLRVENLEIKSPLGSQVDTHLELRLRITGQRAWEWSLEGQTSMQTLLYATGRVVLEDRRRSGTEIQRSYLSILESKHCRGLLADDTAFSASGSIAYKLLEKVAEYDMSYQAIASIKMNEQEALAQVIVPRAAGEWVKRKTVHPVLLDQFTLVAELHALSMIKCKRAEVFTCSEVGETVVYEELSPVSTASWTVYTYQSSLHGRVATYDIYVFDSASRTIIFSVLGAKFVKISSHILQEIVHRANSTPDLSENTLQTKAASPAMQTIQKADPLPTLPTNLHSLPHVWSVAAQLVHELTGYPVERITAETMLCNVGMDSLAATELEHKIREILEADINIQSFGQNFTFGSLVDMVPSQGSSRQAENTGSSICSTPFTSSAGRSSPVSEVDSCGILSDAMIKLCKIVEEYLGSTESVQPGMELRSLGLDSLVTMELESELYKTFGQQLSLMQMGEEVTINELHDLLMQSHLATVVDERIESKQSIAWKASQSPHFVDEAADTFALVQYKIGEYAEAAHFLGFFDRVYPQQMSLVLAYVTEAFAALGCDLSEISPGSLIPCIPHIPKHDNVIAYYHHFLHQVGLIIPSDNGFIRTSEPCKRVDPGPLHLDIVHSFPYHGSEHELLRRTGAQLADCLTGKADALRLLFSDKTTGELLQDVYTNAPMFKMGTLILGHFLPQALESFAATCKEPVRILELGAGTGGTTRFILDQLVTRGIPIQYTFTDISSTLVSRARDTFRAYDCVEYMTLNVEQIPPEVAGSYDVILSSNCIHATKDLRQSCQGLYDLLRPKGMLCLLELTRDVPWLDLTFGLLDGWWRFDDGREHALANEQMWKRLLQGAGFTHVDWSNDESRESDVFRLIMALKK